MSASAIQGASGSLRQCSHPITDEFRATNGEEGKQKLFERLNHEAPHGRICGEGAMNIHPTSLFVALSFTEFSASRIGRISTR
jgi:hypothetical protein